MRVAERQRASRGGVGPFLQRARRNPCLDADDDVRLGVEIRLHGDERGDDAAGVVARGVAEARRSCRLAVAPQEHELAGGRPGFRADDEVLIAVAVEVGERHASHLAHHAAWNPTHRRIGLELGEGRRGCVVALPQLDRAVIGRRRLGPGEDVG